MDLLQYKKAVSCNMNLRERRKPKIPFYVKKYKFEQRDSKTFADKLDSLSLILKTRIKVEKEDNPTELSSNHCTLHDTSTPECTHNNKNKV